MTPDQYRIANPECEYCPYIGTGQQYHPRGSTLELDHIWGRKGPCDVVSNWAMACPQCHDRKTVKLQKLARLAITYHKIMKGEFDEAELKDCSGYHVIGWVENLDDTIDLEGRWKHYAEQIIKHGGAA